METIATALQAKGYLAGAEIDRLMGRPLRRELRIRKGRGNIRNPSPEGPELGELHPLPEVIDELCDILGGKRQLVIDGLAEIVRCEIACNVVPLRGIFRVEA